MFVVPRRFTSFAAVVLVGVAFASPVAAAADASAAVASPRDEPGQDVPSEATEDVAADEVVEDEIVVVGRYLYADKVNALRTPTPILDVPQSLSISTADQLASQGFSSIGEIIDYTPGVSTSQGEGHRDAIVFRGVRSTADFFIDGIRDDVQYYRPLYNLEQVEILRGPNALALWSWRRGWHFESSHQERGSPGESFSTLPSQCRLVRRSRRLSSIETLASRDHVRLPSERFLRGSREPPRLLRRRSHRLQPDR